MIKDDLVNIYNDGIKDTIRLIEKGVNGGLSYQDSFEAFKRAFERGKV